MWNFGRVATVTIAVFTGIIVIVLLSINTAVGVVVLVAAFFIFIQGMRFLTGCFAIVGFLVSLLFIPGGILYATRAGEVEDGAVVTVIGIVLLLFYIFRFGKRP